MGGRRQARVHEVSQQLAGAGLAYAERRLRPLARRAARILRPLFVAMRARKPWLRLRLRLLGWNVRFMASSPGEAREWKKAADSSLGHQACQRQRTMGGRTWFDCNRFNEFYLLVAVVVIGQGDFCGKLGIRL